MPLCKLVIGFKFRKRASAGQAKRFGWTKKLSVLNKRGTGHERGKARPMRAEHCWASVAKKNTVRAGNQKGKGSMIICPVHSKSTRERGENTQRNFNRGRTRA